MFKLASPLFLIAETPLHAGSGNDLGIVDLPIQREKHTGFPKIEASGLKGSLREIFTGLKSNIPQSLTDEFTEPKLDSSNFDKTIALAFGPDGGETHAGALGFTDARLLLFPVKSIKGVFAWITCPMILEKLKSDLNLVKQSNSSLTLPEINGVENKAPHDSQLFVKDNKIILEEYTFEITKDENDGCSKLAEWFSKNVLPKGNEYNYWREKMKKDIVVLSDSDFTDFVTLSTEVIARTKINPDTGTVDKETGSLWYEEYLPADTILYSLVLTTPIFNHEKGIFKESNGKKEETRVMEFFNKGLPEVIQIGGNATIGKGLVRVVTYNNGGRQGD